MTGTRSERRAAPLRGLLATAVRPVVLTGIALGAAAMGLSHVAEAAATIGIDPSIGQPVVSLSLGVIVCQVYRRWHRRRPSTLPRGVGDTARAGAEDRPPRPQECEVSVLFVDIRGYSTLAKDCDATTLFSTVNRYTE